jgi:putative ABC transport system substrate-binding protein
MRRREFLAAAASASIWPRVAVAQSARPPIVGFLSVRSAEDAIDEVAAFRLGLKEGGYVENQNIRVEYRWGEGRYERLQSQVDELIGLGVSIIAGFGPVPALAAKSRTKTIPIVFTSSADPVKAGLVDSLNRPGGNITGISYLAVDLGLKRLELLHEWLPEAKLVGFLINPAYTDAGSEADELKKGGQKVGVDVRVQEVRDESELPASFTKLKDQGVSALMIPGDAFFNRMRRAIVSLADQNKMVTVYPWKGYVIDGGLLSYGPSLSDGFLQNGVYVSKILKGVKAGDLPVLQPTKFEIAINLKTAKLLGLTTPPTLLARADEVIE